MDISASEQQCLGVVCLHQVFPGLLAASNSHFCILKLIPICVFHGKHCLEVRAGGCFKRLQCRVTGLERCLSDVPRSNLQRLGGESRESWGERSRVDLRKQGCYQQWGERRISEEAAVVQVNPESLFGKYH